MEGGVRATIEVPTRLAAGVVYLRALRDEDVEPYARAFAEDRDLGRLLGFEVDPTADLLRERWVGAAERAAEGRGVELAIVDAEQDSFLGSVLLHSLSWRHRRCEIGFWLVPGARGRGVATRAVGRTLDWCFDSLGMERVEMTTTPDNAPTRAFALALGFTEEGRQRRRAVERGQRLDFVVYGLLGEDWRRGRMTAE